jgi:hypothetical protein
MQDYNFAVVLYGSETWSMILSEENRLWVFQKRVMREYFGRRGTEWWEDGEESIMRSFDTSKWSYPRNRPWRPKGLWDVEDPTLSSKRLTDGGKVTIRQL